LQGIKEDGSVNDGGRKTIKKLSQYLIKTKKITLSVSSFDN